MEAFLSATPSRAVRERPLTTVGDAGADLPRFAPPTQAEVLADQEAELATRIVRRAPAAVELNGTLVTAVAPYSGRAGAGFEGRRRVGAAPELLDRLAELGKALAGDGIDLLAGEALVLGLPNAARDIDERRAGIEAKGAVPVRVVAADSVGSVVLDAFADDGAVVLPHRTARVAVIAGAAADAAPGWQTTTRLVQLGARAFAGPGYARGPRHSRSARSPRGERLLRHRGRRGRRILDRHHQLRRRADCDRGRPRGARRARRPGGARARPRACRRPAGRGLGRPRGDLRRTRRRRRPDRPRPRGRRSRGDRRQRRGCPARGSARRSGVGGTQLAEQLRARGFDGLLSNLVSDAGAAARARWAGQDEGLRMRRNGSA